MLEEAATLFPKGRHLSFDSKKPPGVQWKQPSDIKEKLAQLSIDVADAEAALRSAKTALAQSEQLLASGVALVNCLLKSAVSNLRDGKQPFEDASVSEERLKELAMGVEPNRLLGALLDVLLHRVELADVHTHLPQALLDFALVLFHTSPASLRQLRAAMPGLWPSESTLQRNLRDSELEFGLSRESMSRLLQVCLA